MEREEKQLLANWRRRMKKIAIYFLFFMILFSCSVEEQSSSYERININSTPLYYCGWDYNQIVLKYAWHRMSISIIIPYLKGGEDFIIYIRGKKYQFRITDFQHDNITFTLDKG